jgi:hypothetical protein
MPPPTTSVIIPAYQAAPYLDAALGSVAAQTHPADEVVVIDDASVDETGMIAERWARVLPINLIRKSTNEGLGAARATGIAASSGELVALLDSDDVLFPDHLDVLLDQYQRRPGIVTSGYFRWWPGRAVDTKPSYVLNSVPPPDGQRLEILRRNFINVTALFSREDYERAGGFSARRKDEDWDLWIRMIRNGVEVSHPSTVTMLYRQRADSLAADDGCLDDDLQLLRSLSSVAPDEAAVLKKTIRRLAARRDLLDGYELARQGEISQARKRWMNAAVGDRSIRLGPGQRGSTSLRALACFVAPRRAIAYRDGRRAVPTSTGR